MHPLATLVYFHLKYCERCGGLWLRPDGTAAPYCPGCEHLIGALPVRAPRANRKRVPASRAPAAPELLSAAADFTLPGSVGAV